MPGVHNVYALSVPVAYDVVFDSSSDEDINEEVKMEGFAEEIAPNMTHRQFKSHFRISPETFEAILNKISTVAPISVRPGPPSITLEKQLMIAIWYLANIESLRGIALRFGVSKSTAWKVLYHICHLLLQINTHYGIISWPNEEKALNIINAFHRKTKFPIIDVLGAIDGSHIPIKAPTLNHVSYINRKNYHSVLLQDVCNNRYEFTDVYCGEAGSVHDSVLFRRSDLYRQLPHVNFPRDSHLLGDSAYPLTTRCLVPFKNMGNMTIIKKNYNVVHSKTRVVIEQAFALLKGRFRRLKFIENGRIDLIPLLIMAACILHNVCIANADILENLNLRNELQEERLLNVHVPHPNDRVFAQAAKNKRDVIARTLPLLRQLPPRP